ncbi:MAG: OmpH family outer membrane protein [Ignavibacteria bacterium]|jgi:outer membrane protein|nr:OmpH family outer membrane protein [Ignavibacteria bacterium]
MKKILLLLTLAVLTSTTLLCQRVGFFSSQMVRDKLPDARLAEQRCQSMVDEWNRELKSMEDKEESLQFEMKKNRLIWSDGEKALKDKELSDLQTARAKYAQDKYAPGGEYDKVIKEIMTPVEEKIFAAVQEVASKQKYDFIWDQSTQPLAYVNFKYDITLKVLKLLGVDVAAEEKEQEGKIAQDPRNDEDKKKESTTPRRRSRTNSKTDDVPLEQRALEQQNLTPDPLNEKR